ncbi:MAG TPA: hypothetical protein VFI34_04825 [Candidatus Limnocylindrales bacterium]|nr:hypothetical protein [Candidatus Limnocylindrales bacterium]
MSGYAASARIVAASPRVIRRVGPARSQGEPVAAARAVIVDGALAPAPAAPISIGERCGRFRDRWSQLTFFLTDADSWR